MPERKKGAPKWKRTQQEIELLEKRISQETPPPGVLYYKFKQEEGKEEETMTQKMANLKIQETNDKQKIKIRFSDLPISKSTVSGLFKSKFIKMTET